MTVAFERPAWSVADVIADSGAEFLQRHGGHLTGTQQQALRDLARCRTAALGGHVHHCRDCGRDRIAYNSCRSSSSRRCDSGTWRSFRPFPCRTITTMRALSMSVTCR